MSCRADTRGGIAILMALTLVMATLVSLTAVHQLLLTSERQIGHRWEALQAQALAEGVIDRILAGIDDPRPVDGHCRVDPNAALGASDSNHPGAPGGSSLSNESRTFADRILRPGGHLRCRVALQGPHPPGSWMCDCSPSTSPASPVAAELGPASTGTVEHPSSGRLGGAEALLEAVTPDDPALLRLVASGCMWPAPQAVGQGCGAIDPTGSPVWRHSVLLRRVAEGAWREVVGSWEGP